MLSSGGGGSEASDPFSADTWVRTNVRDGSTVGITTTFAKDGNGSFEFTGNSSVSKADVAYYADFGTLGGLTSASYDWYRDGSSTVADHLQIAFRLIYDNDGNLATTNDQGSLVFEQTYNTGGAAAAVNSWVTSNINLSTILWQSSTGEGVNEIYTRTLGDWTSYTQTGTETTAGYDQLSASSRIIGISFGSGSGWSGTFDGAVDNVSISSTTPGASSLSNANFEVVVPEPSSAMLLGVVGGLALFRRRRIG